jgi:Na+-transporting NADH:ubiquinone oxidoreductase subunit A
VEKTRIKIKKGLDLRLSGAPKQVIEKAPRVSSVGLIGPDYAGMKPTMLVEEGDRVKLGQPLFEDKKNPGVLFTSPGAGTVTTINRGPRRVLQSVVVSLDGDDQETFEAHSASSLAKLDPQKVREQLIQSGAWTALRTRPFGKVPPVDGQASAIFVNAIDSHPLSGDPAVILKGDETLFKHGLQVLSRLTDGPVWLCTAPNADIPMPDSDRVRVAEFEGVHPAGLVSTHMHFLHPVSATRFNWHLGPQDVVAIGHLFTTGRIRTERVVALGGPVVKNPRLLRTRVGANIDDLLKGELKDVDARAISGSVWNGRRAGGWAAYLGRYSTQISVLPEGHRRRLFGWINPFGERFSVTRVLASALSSRDREFELDTSTNGSPRAMVPIGSYEKVMPLDILPTQLMRALLVRDTDSAQQLGVLELIEEDVSLMSFVCVGKYDFGPHLRASLDLIEKEG